MSGAVSGRSQVPKPCKTRQRAGSQSRLLTYLRDRQASCVSPDPAVARVPRLGATRLRALTLLLAIRRGRLGGGARGLLRPLQAQHQLDQLFLAQALKLNTTHPALESAKTPSLKGVGNCSMVIDL